MKYTEEIINKASTLVEDIKERIKREYQEMLECSRRKIKEERERKTYEKLKKKFESSEV